MERNVYNTKGFQAFKENAQQDLKRALYTLAVFMERAALVHFVTKSLNQLDKQLDSSEDTSNN